MEWACIVCPEAALSQASVWAESIKDAQWNAYIRAVWMA